VSFTNAHLSFSRLSKFEACPLSFKLHYVDKVPAEPGVPLLFGSTIHTVLEKLLQEVILDETTGPLNEARGFELLREEWPASGLTGVELFTEALNIVRAFVRDEGVVDHRDVLAVEKEFLIPAGPFAVLGYIDRVNRLDDETVEIVDYKTNRIPFTREEVDQSLQMSLYHVAARRLFPWARNVKLTFHLLRHSIRMSTERSPEQIVAALGYASTLGRMTEEATEFPPRLGPNCAYCDHKGRCPAYAEALASGHVEMSADPADLESIGREREGLAHRLKILEARKNELDKVLKTHLKERDELVLAGVRYAVFKVSKTSYPLAPTLAALAKATGQDEGELIAKVGAVDKDALDALVKKLGRHLDKSKVLMLRAELEAVAEKSFTPRLWAKQVHS
jgi:RecB family exonuclease